MQASTTSRKRPSDGFHAIKHLLDGIEIDAAVWASASS
jgi:hypothetical protein